MSNAGWRRWIPGASGVRAGGGPSKRRGRPSAGALRLPCHDGVESTVPGVDGVELWYRVVGDGDLTMLVPCCGNAEDLAGLAGPGRRVVFYDVRNRGRSASVEDPAKLGFVAEVADVAVLRAVLGITQCALFGWSYHAGVLAAHALENPGLVSQLVLAAPVALRSGTSTRPGREAAPADLARLDQLQADGLSESDPEAWCAAWREVYVPLLLADRSAFERMTPVCHLTNEHPAHVVTAMVTVFASMGSYDWREALAMLTVPTLVVQGDEDAEPLDSAYEWASSVQHGNVEVLDGAGQLPWVDRPDAFFAVIDRFLASTS